MKHLKLFEEFESKFFSKNYEELRTEEFDKWREGWLEGYKYLYWKDDSEVRDFYKNIKELLESIIGDVHISPEFVHDDTDKVFLKAVICFCNATKQRILIRPFNFNGIGFMVSIFGPDADIRDYTKAMGNFLCYENDTDPFESLEELLSDKASEGLFTKSPKTPKSYKSEPTLNDEDFTDRGMDNQMRSKFYKEQGRIIRDLTREEALKVLDEWVSNN